MESIYESQVDPLRPNDAHGISLQLVGKDKNVLELGAASGHVTKALKDLNNTVTAVERDGRFKGCLTELADEVVITDLDWLDLRECLLGKKFDVVLAGDVLEHCSHPELVLLQLHDLLAEGGYVVISLPNIAHGDVRLALLTGAFDYRETGLLDKTHLRFFTRSSIETFLTENDFLLDEIFASTASIGTTEFGTPDASIPIEAIRFVQEDRDSAVYQFVVKASPKPLRRTESIHNPTPRTGDTQVDQLLAEICLYQESISHSNELNQQEAERIFDYLGEIDQLTQNLETSRDETRLVQERYETSQHETNLANIRVIEMEQKVLEMEQKVLECYQLMELQESKIKESQLSFLDARDHAIGAAAELGEIRFLYESTIRERDSLNYQLNILHGSRTWRIGRFVLLPLRAIRKVLRLLTD